MHFQGVGGKGRSLSQSSEEEDPSREDGQLEVFIRSMKLKPKVKTISAAKQSVSHFMQSLKLPSAPKAPSDVCF